MTIRTALVGEHVPCTCLDFSPDSDTVLVSGHANGSLSVWDVLQNKVTRRMKLGGYSVDMVRYFNEDSKFLICFVKQIGTFYKIDVADFSVVLGVSDKTVLNEMGTMVAVQLSQSNKYLALAGTKGEIVMYNMDTEQAENRMLIEPEMTCLDWAGNNGLIVGDFNGAVHLFI